jgi:hypothetical protein
VRELRALKPSRAGSALPAREVSMHARPAPQAAPHGGVRARSEPPPRATGAGRGIAATRITRRPRPMARRSARCSARDWRSRPAVARYSLPAEPCSARAVPGTTSARRCSASRHTGSPSRPAACLERSSGRRFTCGRAVSHGDRQMRIGIQVR